MDHDSFPGQSEPTLVQNVAPIDPRMNERDAALPVPAGMQDELVFESRQKITLRCGKSSITLHPNGKIVLRGEYILSDAEGINRIAGGQIELN